MQHDKDVLIKYRIERSKDTIEEVKLAMDNGRLHLAENRIYYSIFYLVSALALKYNYSTSKHAQLLGWFNKNFVHTNKVPIDLSRIYKKAFENRQEGDYDDMVTFTIEQVKSDYENLLYFFEKVQVLF